MIIRMIKDVEEDSPVLYCRWKTEIFWKSGERFLTAEEGKREKIFIVRLVIEGDGLEECFWLVLKKTAKNFKYCKYKNVRLKYYGTYSYPPVPVPARSKNDENVGEN
jgi:hypothetical protein